MSTAKEIWVFAEQENGRLAGVALELLSEGRKLAEKSGYTLCAMLASADGAPLHQELFNFGAKKIYNIEDPKLATYQNDYFAKAVHTLIDAEKPEIVLYGASTIGRSLAPTVAVNVTSLPTQVWGMLAAIVTPVIGSSTSSRAGDEENALPQVLLATTL